MARRAGNAIANLFPVDLDDRQKAAVRWPEAVTKMTARDDDEAFAQPPTATGGDTPCSASR